MSDQHGRDGSVCDSRSCWSIMNRQARLPVHKLLHLAQTRTMLVLHEQGQMPFGLVPDAHEYVRTGWHERTTVDPWRR
ncbi:unnamed protein product, partial [Nesidiocoris tenuis]